LDSIELDGAFGRRAEGDHHDAWAIRANRPIRRRRRSRGPVQATRSEPLDLGVGVVELDWVVEWSIGA
jgi:hypothetical protein